MGSQTLSCAPLAALSALLMATGCSLITGRGEFSFADAGADASAAMCAEPADCPAMSDTVFECVEGACVGTRCAPGLRSCDGDSATGCETSIEMSVEHCGGCARSCDGRHAIWSCASGACAVETCEPGFADCDGDPSDGCEVDSNTDRRNCGGCGVTCEGGCTDGVCDPVVAIDSARNHSCAVLESGLVKCWGRNRAGGVGDGTQSPAPRATTVVEGDSTPFRAAAIAVTVEASCAVQRPSGRLFCWGRGGFGENGNPELATSERMATRSWRRGCTRRPWSLLILPSKRSRLLACRRRGGRSARWRPTGRCGVGGSAPSGSSATVARERSSRSRPRSTCPPA